MTFFEVLMPFSVFAGIALVIKVITDAITRSKLINKGMVDENVKYLFSKYGKSDSLSNIKYGLILVGIGLAIFIREMSTITDEMMLGLMFVFAGAAFLIYFPLAKKRDEDIKKQISS